MGRLPHAAAVDAEELLGERIEYRRLDSRLQLPMVGADMITGVLAASCRVHEPYGHSLLAGHQKRV